LKGIEVKIWDSKRAKRNEEAKTMDELIKLVTQKVGIPEEQAKQAVETVMGFLKDKLPGPVASQVEAVLSGGEIPDVGDLGKKLGGLLGK
jgi:hypothetical protein